MLNQILWGDIVNDRKYGVILHNPYFGKNLKPGYRPASIVHASMRASDPMYRKLWQKYNTPYVGLVVGSKSKFNMSSKSNNGENTEKEVVECDAFYPTDAASDETRDSSLVSTTTHHGTSCSPWQLNQTNGDLCNNINGKCLTSRERNCMCNYESVPGKEFADYFIRIPISNNVRSFPKHYSCWYPGTALGIQEMVAASNSVYLNRRVFWYNRTYRGHTECSCTPNVMAKEMSDAMIIILPPDKNSLCSLSFGDAKELKGQLLQYHYKQYTSVLPIVVMQQTKGLNEEECDRLWGGTSCSDGYRKVFFSQSFFFRDGSCIAKRYNQQERYYIKNITECATLKDVVDNTSSEGRGTLISNGVMKSSQLHVGDNMDVLVNLGGTTQKNHQRTAHNLLLLILFVTICSFRRKLTTIRSIGGMIAKKLPTKMK